MSSETPLSTLEADIQGVCTSSSGKANGEAAISEGTLDGDRKVVEARVISDGPRTAAQAPTFDAPERPTAMKDVPGDAAVPPLPQPRSPRGANSVKNCNRSQGVALEEGQRAPEWPIRSLGSPRQGQSPNGSPRVSEISGRSAQDGHYIWGRAKSGVFLFANSDAIKEKVRNRMLAPLPYDVKDFYHTKGFFQWLAKHSRFENTTLGVIVINALWISVDTDGNTSDTILDAKPMYITADVLFFTYFVSELFVRIMAFKRKRDSLHDAWFCFDSTLVALYAFDPFLLGFMAYMSGGGGIALPTAMLRLCRLARLSRLIRMLRSLPELMIMIKGMMKATTSVGYTLMLLILITYVFSIALRNLVPAGSELEETYFISVPETMHNLIIYGTFLDALSDFILLVKEKSTPCFILCWLYISLASLTVMNMLIGVLCEVISAVAEEEKESMMVDKVNDKFKSIVYQLDTSGDGSLSWAEFQKMLDMPEALQSLESVGVDPEIMVDMAEDFFFDDGEEIGMEFGDFMCMVLDLRGGQQATVEHVMTLAKRFSNKFMKVRDRMETFGSRLADVDKGLDSLLRKQRKSRASTTPLS